MASRHREKTLFGLRKGTVCVLLLGCLAAGGNRTESGNPPDVKDNPASATVAVGRKKVEEPYRWRNVNITAGGFVDGLLFSPTQKGLIYARTDIGGAYRWEAGAGRWIPLNDWAGGKDANLLGCESLAVDPSDARRLYMAAGTYTQSWAGNGAMLRSVDQGRTWKRTDMPFKMGGNEDGRSIGERLAVDPNKSNILYFGSRHDGLWRSEDYGATWSKVESFPIKGRTNGIGIGFIVFDKGASSRGQASDSLYIGAAVLGTTLYHSVDAGKTWAAVPGQSTGLLPHQGKMDAAGNLYLTYGNRPGPNGMTDGAVWKLNTHTGAWTDITPVKPGNPSGFGYAGLALDTHHSGTVLVSTMDRWNPGDDVFRSTDGGAHWKSLREKAVLDSSLSPWIKWGGASPKFGWWIGALALDPFAPGHVLYGTGATIWGTDDATSADSDQPTHWSVRAAGLEETAVLCLISPPTGPHLISGLGDIGSFRHDDLNISPPKGMWVQPQIDNTDSLDYAENRPEMIVKVGRGGRGQNGAYSLDSGATWTAFAGAPPGSRGAGSIAVSADGQTLVWSPQGGVASYSRDRGATWTACASLEGGRFIVVSDRVTPAIFYAYVRKGDRLLVSTDGGKTFTAKDRLPAQASQIHATPGHSGDLWLTAGNQGLFHSADGGAHFLPVGHVPDADGFGFGKAAPGQTYPALYLTGQTSNGESGVFRSDDTGQTWVRLNDAQHQYGWSGQVVTGDPRIYGRVYMGSNGRGTLYGDLPPAK